MNTNSQYDIVIIGSGLGGLLAATLLAKEGMKVCVLEKNKQHGGCLQTFSLQKHVFDSCVHYIGGLGAGHTLHEIFRYAGIIDKLTLKDYDSSGFDRIYFGESEQSYPLANGKKSFIAQLSDIFPEEQTSLTAYVDLLEKICDHFPLYRLRNGDANEKAPVIGMELTATIAGVTQNPLLQNVLMGNNLLYAGVKNKTPFYLHALVSESYIHSAHKVLPGSSQIAKFLAQEIRAHGGEIIRNTAVHKLVEEKGRIQYAVTEQGERFYGKQFIANIHPQILLRILDSNIIKPAFKNRIYSLAQTASSFMLNLVLKTQAVPMRHHNIYWHQSGDALQAIHYKNFPETFAVYFTESKQYPGYAESISILTYMNFEEVSGWQKSHNHSGRKEHRGKNYEMFKQQKSAQLLAKIYPLLPELKGNILAEAAATPLTFRDYTATPEGALYGIQKNVHKPAETTIATKTKISNLYLTGQNINLHGVLGVSITALATCAELIGMDYLLKKIHS